MRTPLSLEKASHAASAVADDLLCTGEPTRQTLLYSGANDETESLSPNS